MGQQSGRVYWDGGSAPARGSTDEVIMSRWPVDYWDSVEQLRTGTILPP